MLIGICWWLESEFLFIIVHHSMRNIFRNVLYYRADYSFILFVLHVVILLIYYFNFPPTTFDFIVFQKCGYCILTVEKQTINLLSHLCFPFGS